MTNTEKRPKLIREYATPDVVVAAGTCGVPYPDAGTAYFSFEHAFWSHVFCEKHPDWFEWISVCLTCQREVCPGQSCKYMPDNTGFTPCCIGHEPVAPPEPELPYPDPLPPTGPSPLRPEDIFEWSELAGLMLAVYRNRRNRDANPLKDGETAFAVLWKEFEIIEISHISTKFVGIEQCWRTRAEAETFAKLLRLLLGGKDGE